MFGKGKSPPVRSLIDDGTTLTGEIRFGEGLRIDGSGGRGCDCRGRTPRYLGHQ